jgi:hypothetical protein
MDSFSTYEQKLSEGILLEEQGFMGGAGLEIGGEGLAEIEELILDMRWKLIDRSGSEAMSHRVFADSKFACESSWAG